ncbi:MAG: GAF domain-containing protein [Bacteroidetes bacterium]|nr:GAF domain-containing protein [Bacteroidota bacterium]
MILILLISVAMVRNIIMTGGIEGKGLVYILLSFAIAGVFLLYLIILRLTGWEIKNYFIAEYNAEKNETEEEEKVEEVQEQTDEKILTLEELERNIFPQKKFKYLDSYAEKLLINLGKFMEISQGVFYRLDDNSGKFRLIAKYATAVEKEAEEIGPGEGLTGQVAIDKKMNIIDEVPENYLQIVSGLGKGQPAQLVIVPILKNNEVSAIMELASLKKFSDSFLSLLPDLANNLGKQIDNFELR